MSKLSESGQGEVYIVEHVELGKSFAAKLLLNDSMQDPRAVDRFRRQAQSLGRLRHPNIVDISGFGHTSSGVPFMLMELLKGWTIEEELCQYGAVAPTLACEWIAQILSALEAVHDLGIVHRDVGPEHVFLHQPPQGPRQPKLTGFGLVRVANGDRLGPTPLRIPTDMGVVVGNPRYSSPEAARGEPADARSDLYQAGQLLLLMLIGARPIDSQHSIENWLTTASWRHLGMAAPGLSGLLSRALSPVAQQRFSSAGEFRKHVEQLRQELTALPIGVELTLEPLHPEAARATRTQMTARLASWAIFVALVALMAIVIVIVGIRLRGEP
ncbi:MAG TPA: serine/threonine-protein kinase [Polyangiaceae bacterium]